MNFSLLKIKVKHLFFQSKEVGDIINVKLPPVTLVTGLKSFSKTFTTAGNPLLPKQKNTFQTRNFVRKWRLQHTVHKNIFN